MTYLIAEDFQKGIVQWIVEMMTVELLEELEAFDPMYRTRYRSLREAAHRAGLAAEFAQWLKSEDGQRYLRAADAHDHVADNEARKRQVEAEREMFSRGRANASRGFTTARDEL